MVDSLTTEGDILWALVDQVGTIRDIGRFNDTSGQFEIANHRVYDSFGNLTSETNATVNLDFGFTGRWTDAATGMTNHLNRWFDPAIGKWLSNDPIGFGGGDANIQRYVANNPLSYTDNNGLKAQDTGGGGDDGGVMGVSGINQGANQGGMSNVSSFNQTQTLAMVGIDLGDVGPKRGTFVQPNIGETLGFWSSIGSSVYGIGQTYYGVGQYVTGNTTGAQETWDLAYANSPFGQTKNSSGIYYFGTRGALGVATVAAGSALFVGGGEWIFTGNTPLFEGNVLSQGNVFKVISRPFKGGFRIDPAHHGKSWGHSHWWRS